MSWIIVGITAAGAAKHFAFDKPKADRQRQLAAETDRYSPWTGMQGELPQESSLGDSLMQGAFTGINMRNSIQTADAQKKLMEGIGDKFKSSTPITSAGQVAQPVVPAGTLPSEMSYVPKYQSPWRLGQDTSLYGK